MPSRRYIWWMPLALLSCAMGLPSMPADAMARSTVTASGAYVHWAQPRAVNVAAYMTLRARGTADALLGATVPRSVARTVLLQRSVSVDNTVVLVQPARIPLPLRRAIQLAPGGYFLQLVEVRPRPATGMPIPLTLTFARAGALRLWVPVRPVTRTADFPDRVRAQKEPVG